MNNIEFSNEFDILYNNIMSNQAPGLDEYEKSVFLTRAQEGMIIGLYNGANSLGDSFEKTEESRRYLESLVKTFSTTERESELKGITEDSVFYSLPEDLWFITYESVKLKDDRLGCLNNSEVPVIPVTQDDFFNIKNNPFRGPGKTRVLRLDTASHIVELVSKYNINNYLVRYLSKPSPIVLEDLEDGLSIDGVSNKTECKINPILHKRILTAAVELAKQSMYSSTGK